MPEALARVTIERDDAPFGVPSFWPKSRDLPPDRRDAGVVGNDRVRRDHDEPLSERLRDQKAVERVLMKRRKLMNKRRMGVG